MYIMYFIVILIIIITIFILSMVCLLTIKDKDINKGVYTNRKHYMWVYWENAYGSSTPDYIKLCMESVKKYCSQDFNLIVLDGKSVYDYLPELASLNMKNLLIAQKVDIIRILLLCKYGGLYVDADTIIMRSPKEIVEKLIDYDYVGFGCTGNKCNYGYGRPSNGIMASRENGVLVSRIKNNILNKIIDRKQWDYFDLGKYIIWEELDILLNDGYEYYHYSNDYDGTRDRYGNWIETSKLFSEDPIDYNNENILLFVILYNSQMDDIRRLDKEYLLNSNLNISKYIRKSLYKR